MFFTINIPICPQDVHHFQLPGYPVWYHTKIRPGAVKFLNSISRLYELHIFTMGSRMYAHTIAQMLDPERKLFAYRIRSRDECFNAFSKSHDLRSVLLLSYLPAMLDNSLGQTLLETKWLDLYVKPDSLIENLMLTVM